MKRLHVSSLTELQCQMFYSAHPQLVLNKALKHGAYIVTYESLYACIARMHSGFLCIQHCENILFDCIVSVLVVFSEQLWLFNGKVKGSTLGDFFHPLNGPELGPPPALTARGRELVSVLQVRNEPGD